MDEIPEQQNERRKRPQLLTILCILSFIFSGLAFFTFLTASTNFQEFKEAMKNMTMDMPYWEALKNAKQGFYVTGALLYGASLFGVIQMWNLRKSGFHFYLGAQVLLTIYPYIYLKIDYFPLLEMLTTAIFIFLYARNLRYMH